MTFANDSIPDLTLKTLARNFFKESQGYGFTQVDYVKFVNVLLDMSMQSDPDTSGRSGSGGAQSKAVPAQHRRDIPRPGTREQRPRRLVLRGLPRQHPRGMAQC